MDSARRNEIQVLANIWFLYCAQACIIPHLTRYYDLDLGLGALQIGILMSAPYLFMILFQPLWGVLADQVLGRTRMYRLGLILSSASLIVYSFSYCFGGFYALLAASIGFMICYGTGSPLSTSIILSYLGRRRRHLFGRVRVFGSASFTVTVFLFCPLAVALSHYFGLPGRTMVFWMGSLFYIAALCFTRWDDSLFERHTKPGFRSFRRLAGDINLIFFLLSLFFVGMTFTSEILYIGPYIGRLGLSEFFFSTMWLIGVGVEIVFTYNLARVVRFTGLKTMIFWGMAAEGIRWLGISLFPSPYAILIFSTLHGPAVLGIFFVTAMYLDSECEESVRSTAQSLLYLAIQGGQITGFILGSFIVDFYSDLPRVEAIRHGFFWFGFNAVAAAFFFYFFVAKETPPVEETPIH
ncbi:MAG: MFS transporter [Candidatus Omnitrophota bacterium]